MYLKIVMIILKNIKSLETKKNIYKQKIIIYLNRWGGFMVKKTIRICGFDHG